MIARATGGDALRDLGAIFLVAVALNYPWELAHGPLFVGMDSFRAMGWHCFVAALGDGVLVWIIHATGCAAFQRADWFERPGLAGYAVMLGMGLALAVGVEWIAVHTLHRWAYTARMPLIPGLGIGVTPVLQMLVLPPLVFYLAAKTVIQCRWR